MLLNNNFLDCYVVLGMVNKNNRCPPLELKNVVMMGFEMINIIY